MITVTRRLTFCAGHRVVGHEGKCAFLHGHNYVVEVTATPTKHDLDAVGRVVDFSVFKQVVGGWLDENWDHSFIAFLEDPELETLRRINGPKRLYVATWNPTAENMARHLFDVFRDPLRVLGVELTKVRVQETENCSAEVTWPSN